MQGLKEKLPYLKDLGINQIQCMPVYEFEECGRYQQLLGIRAGILVCAEKRLFCSGRRPPRSLKDLVKACHRQGMEVVLEMPFSEGMPGFLAEECLRYYRMEYHIDGFILNPLTAPMGQHPAGSAA